VKFSDPFDSPAGTFASAITAVASSLWIWIKRSYISFSLVTLFDFPLFLQQLPILNDFDLDLNASTLDG
jgi:hypothetical protein